jgi:hypothetical protein
MSENATWDTSVNELLWVFRDSLIALIPAMDRAHIPWRDAQAYDDWDAIAETLFRNIVVRTLQYSHSAADPAAFCRYGFTYPSYSGKLFIQVCESPSAQDVPNVFLSFSTHQSPFDSLLVQPVEPASLCASGAPQRIPMGNSYFVYADARDPSKIVRTDTLRVDL